MNPKPPIADVQITVDLVIFTVESKQLKALLVRRDEPPFEAQLSLPGGFMWADETSLMTASRVLNDKTSLKTAFFEQLYSFDEIKRDPRGRIVTLAYFALVPAESISQADIVLSVDEIADLAFDHKQILDYAVSRLRNKLAYSNIAYSLLPKLFTLSQLQEVYEVILGHEIDKRNFRKKIFSLDIIEETNQKQTGRKHRPARLYKFKQHRYAELTEPIF